MVAPNSATRVSSSSFAMLSVPAVVIQPIRRVSNASIDKLAFDQTAKARATGNNKNELFLKKKKVVIKKGTKAKKGVRFSDAATTIVAISAAKSCKPDDTAEASSASATPTSSDTSTWFQPKDYARFKYSILHSIQEIKKVFQQPPQQTQQQDRTTFEQQHCLRGIETAISTQLYQRRKLRIATTKRAVLEQQRQQRLVGITDPLALRDVSMECTKEARESAISTAKLDSRL